MSNLTKEEVEHISKLANLALKDNEKDKFAKQLTEILDFVEKISKVETESVSPLFNVIGKRNVFREDKIKPSLTQEEALKNAESVYQDYFKVKAIFD